MSAGVRRAYGQQVSDPVVEFDNGDGVFAESTDGRFLIDQMYPGEWWVFSDQGHRNAEGQVSMHQLGPKHASYDLAVAWVAGYVTGVEATSPGTAHAVSVLDEHR